ncbi:MAG TPA: BatD family protein [Planctomycetota bacterium]|nr:BatD family protein [Planctomycetota bacterium]
MRARAGVLPLLAFLCGAALGQERAFVEVTAEKDAYYVREPVHLRLRFGYDRDFFRDHAVRLFAREMDVPVQVQARLPGQRTFDPNDRPKGPTFALNDDVIQANAATEEMRDGRVFVIVEMRRDFVPSEPGDVDIPAPTLRYAYATEFHEDFVAGRVAKDPKQEVVSGEALKLKILPLPEEGRPPGFKGAVGRFTVSAEASRTSLAVGETLVLKLKIEGDGVRMVPPDLNLPGLHVLGALHKDTSTSTRVTYDLKALSADVKEIPAIPFAFFDPEPPAGYRVVRTDPIPLDVRPAPGGPASSGSKPPPAEASPTLVPWFLGAAAAVVALLLWLRFRRRPEAEPDPEALRLREAFAALKARVAGGGPGLADAFADFLAAYLKCPRAAVIGPDLAARLLARGFPEPLAARAAALLEHLVAARYGAGGVSAGEVAAVVDGIEAALPPAP